MCRLEILICMQLNSQKSIPHINEKDQSKEIKNFQK